jgi:hypothetical protein
MNGVVQGGITRKFHDPTVNAKYVTGLRNGVQAYGNKFQDEDSSMTGSPTGSRSTDGTDDTEQKLMAYGQSFELDDPLATIYGRNITADTTRLANIQSRMDNLKLQLAILRNIPPLIMLVNPEEFKRTYENTVDAGNKTRVGNIVHTWLEQPMKISASGTSATQFAVGADMSGGRRRRD